jgi:hypothetical protein
VLFQGNKTSGNLIVLVKSRDDHHSLLNEEHVDLKPSPSADPPKFLNYDPKAVLAARKLRSLVVRDIPLHIKDEHIRQKFSKWGNIIKMSVSTPPGSIFRSANIEYEASTSVEVFVRQWSVVLQGEFVRTFPAYYSKEEKDARNTHSLLLRGLPPNIKGIDLARISNDVSAAAVGLPRFVSSYKSKPWAYFNFHSAEAMDAAREVSCSFNGRQLEWLPVEAVSSLCIRCSSRDHSTKDCDAFISRQPKPPTKNVQALYDRFQIRGRTSKRSPASSSSRDPKRSSSSIGGKNPQSRSRSHSRTNKKVSYADAAKMSNSNPSPDDGLDASVHAPTTKNKGKESSIPRHEKEANMASLNSSVLEQIVKEVRSLSEKVSELSCSVMTINETLHRNDEKINSLEELCSSLSRQVSASSSAVDASPTSASSPVIDNLSTRLAASEQNNAQIADQLGRVTSALSSIAQFCNRMGMSQPSSPTSSPTHH